MVLLQRAKGCSTSVVHLNNTSHIHLPISAGWSLGSHWQIALYTSRKRSGTSTVREPDWTKEALH